MAKLQVKAREGGEFELITPGVYEFQIIKADITEDKDGNPQLACEFEIVEGPESGKKVPQWLGTTEKRGWAIRALCDAANVSYDIVSEDDPPEISFETEDLLQRYVRGELSHYENTQKGKTYHNLGKFESSPLQAAAEGGTAPEAPASAPTPAPAAAAAPKAAPQQSVRRSAAPKTA